MPFFDDSTELHVEGAGAAKRIGWMRFVGCGLAALPIASVILERDASTLVWVLLLLNAVVRPTVALAMTHRAREPAVVQFRCMVLDSLLGGAWIAFIAISIVPSALFAALLVADKIAAGGLKLAAKSTAALVLGFIVCWVAIGCPYQPITSVRTVLLSLPFLFVYGIGLSLLSWQLARKVKLQNRRLRRLSRMDPLVELANRGFLIHRTERALETIRQNGGSACLLMLDVDDFKRVNDSFGHRTGDEVLRRIASVLGQLARSTDTPARLGGDEFAVLLDQCSVDEAMHLAGQVRKQLREAGPIDGVDVRFSVSIGIAAAPNKGGPEDWLAIADEALYQAKRQGKDTASYAF